MPLALAGPMHREVPKQRSRDGIRLVATIALGAKFTFDVRGAQSNIADDQLALGVADHADARDTRSMIMPRMALEPAIERFPAAIERAALVILGERPRRLYLRHVGGLRASSLSDGMDRVGLAAHDSKRAQSFAGI